METKQETEIITLKENVIFHDAENNLCDINIEIKNGVLSISGDVGGAGGQCQDEIKPKTKEQIRLIEIWNKWHLNDMNAGTEKQEAIIKKYWDNKKYAKFDKFLDRPTAILKAHKLFVDNGYTYGSKWLKRDFPKGLESELKTLCSKIRSQETERKESFKLKSFPEDTEDEVIALALSLDLEPAEALEDIKQSDYDRTTYEYCGKTYFVGTEEQAKERCEDYLDKDMWIEAVKADRTTSSFEDWQDDVIQMDGFGQILNSYDGSEDSQKVNGIWYYVIQM